MKTRTQTFPRLSIFCGVILLIAHSEVFADSIETVKPEPVPVKVLRTSEGFAVWYRVPINSLARRRANGDEFTAAHNRLPIGTHVRVTRLSNGCSVVVRITDRGITNRRAKIDICKEAAEELGMVREGLTRVRLEVIAEKDLPTVTDASQLPAH